MSEPIQSISQGNYILHNIDAKKLYVQEPLFTANSGDAVYVGWRPDETVLWEGNGTGAGYNTEITLTTPTSAFESVKFYWAGENGGNVTTFRVNEFVITDTRSLCFDGLWQRYSDGKWNFGGFELSANADLTKYKMTHNYRYNLRGNLMDVGNDASNFAYVHKIVGINRKENA